MDISFPNQVSHCHDPCHLHLFINISITLYKTTIIKWIMIILLMILINFIHHHSQLFCYFTLSPSSSPPSPPPSSPSIPPPSSPSIPSPSSAVHRRSVLRCHKRKETSLNRPKEWATYLRGDYIIMIMIKIITINVKILITIMIIEPNEELICEVMIMIASKIIMIKIASKIIMIKIIMMW